MTATIRLSFNRDGQEISYEAIYDGERWVSEDDFTARFLNACTKHRSLRDYHPDSVIGMAMEIVEELKDPLKAEFVKSDEVDYSDVPDDAVF